MSVLRLRNQEKINFIGELSPASAAQETCKEHVKLADKNKHQNKANICVCV